jgi:hypothetical protein
MPSLCIHTMCFNTNVNLYTSTVKRFNIIRITFDQYLHFLLLKSKHKVDGLYIILVKLIRRLHLRPRVILTEDNLKEIEHGRK